jgi:amino acid adenylation domain-containing protein
MNAGGNVSPSTIHGLVARQAGRSPAAVAVRSRTAAITYAQLETQSNRLAHLLRQRGTGRDTLIAIQLPGSIDAVVAMLAVLKCGASYLPLDPTHPHRRNRAVIEDARPRGLLAYARDDTSLATEIQTTFIDAIQPEIARQSADPLDDIATDRHLAYVIYTSGSTGRPKGVAIEHGSVCNLIAAQIEAFAIGPGSCVLQFASLAFDASISEVFTALASGAALRVAASDELFAPEPLLTTLGDRVTVVTLPPSLLAVLPEDRIPCVETVVSAGESCSDEIVARWSQGRRFINAYGPTEATVCATVHHAGAGSPGAVIGTPLAGVSAYVLDARGRPVPLGVKGELYVGGKGIARGYVNDPQLTAARFVPDPFSAQPGARMYRTGDLVRKRTNGWLEFVGRIDRQIKIRGHRVDPREIEEALIHHSTVADAVVTSSNTATGPRLTAYVVPRGNSFSSDDLRRFLRTTLPEYMVPAQLVAVPELPLTPSGKIDHAQLPSPDGLAARRAVQVKPRTAVEEALSQIWCDVLGLPSVGVTDDFFELGGHSVAAVRVVARIEELWGRIVPISELLEDRTIEHLATVVHSERFTARTSTPIVSIQRQGAAPPLLLCHALGGTALSYITLGKHLAPDLPVWGLESPALFNGASPPSSWRSMARSLADAVDGTGITSCFVGGWSFGGVLAFELARELESRGCRVERVFLLDPGPPAPLASGGDDLLEMVSGFAQNGGWRFQPELHANDDLEAQLNAIGTRLREQMPDATAAALTSELRAAAAHIALRQAYEPSGTCRASVVLFDADSGVTREATDRYAWAALTTGDFVVIAAECGHGALLSEPYVATIAGLIRQHCELTSAMETCDGRSERQI